MMDVFILSMYALLTTTLAVWLYVEYRTAMRGWKRTSRQRDRALEQLERWEGFSYEAKMNSEAELRRVK
jgi:hypothetical protein